MNDLKAQAPPASQMANYPLNFMSVRYVLVDTGVDGERALVYATDACHALDVPTEALAAVTDDQRAHVTVYENGSLTETLVLTVTGVQQLTSQDGDPKRSRFVTWVETELTPRRGGHRAPNPQRTKWGWQPIRDLVRERGYTARRFTEEANALDLPVDRFNQGNYIAWAYGGCLPAESLVTRTCALLSVEPRDLFNEDVLAAYPNRGKGRRRRAEALTGE
jgi:prophage antirepressor-like protein